MKVRECCVEPGHSELNKALETLKAAPRHSDSSTHTYLEGFKGGYPNSSGDVSSKLFSLPDRRVVAAEFISQGCEFTLASQYKGREGRGLLIEVEGSGVCARSDEERGLEGAEGLDGVEEVGMLEELGRMGDGCRRESEVTTRNTIRTTTKNAKTKSKRSESGKRPFISILLWLVFFCLHLTTSLAFRFSNRKKKNEQMTDSNS